jgi:hypothetical protein
LNKETEEEQEEEKKQLSMYASMTGIYLYA